MVRARLHTICGNCGCDDEFVLEIKRDFIDVDGENFEDEAVLICNNCDTMHFLTQSIPEKKRRK